MIARQSSSGAELLPSVLKGTPRAILATLLSQSLPVSDQTTFLLTYESFLSTPQLFRHLRALVPQAIPSRLASFTREFFYLAKLHPQPPARLARLVDIVSAKLDRYDMNQIKLMCLASATSRVTPLRASRSGRSAKLDKLLGNEVLFEYIFDAFPAKGIAERLTFLEWEIFLRIRPSELLGTAWQSEQKHKTAPNIVALIEHFNRVVGWVATEIVSAPSNALRLRRASAVIEAMTQYGLMSFLLIPIFTFPATRSLLSFERCNTSFFILSSIALSVHLIKFLSSALSLHSYNAAMELYSALNSAAVQRLKRMWTELPSDDRKAFEKAESLFAPNSNFAALMEHMRTLPITTPVLPYLGVHLKELALIDLGNPTWLEGKPRTVNFAKSQLMARSLIELLKRKLCGFQCVPNAKLDEQLLSAQGKTDEELWAMTEAYRGSVASSQAAAIAAALSTSSSTEIALRVSTDSSPSPLSASSSTNRSPRADALSPMLHRSPSDGHGHSNQLHVPEPPHPRRLSLTDELERLAQMRRDNIISEEEFTVLKAKLFQYPFPRT